VWHAEDFKGRMSGSRALEQLRGSFGWPTETWRAGTPGTVDDGFREAGIVLKRVVYQKGVQGSSWSGDGGLKDGSLGVLTTESS